MRVVLDMMLHLVSYVKKKKEKCFLDTQNQFVSDIWTNI